MSKRETKHTPGPWHLDSLQVGGPDRLRVADVWTSDRPITEQRANARLVAAAPDLLGALREMVAISEHDYLECRKEEDGPGLGSRGQRFVAAYEDSRAAIARATGGSDA